MNSKPVATAIVERNSVEVAQAVAAINAAGPDGVVQISTYKTSAAYIREARKAGYGGQFFPVSFVGTQALSDALGTDGAGVVVSQDMPSPYVKNRIISHEFLDAVKRTNGQVRANYSSMEGYVAARVLCEGLRRAGPKGGSDALVAGLESIGSMRLGDFPITLSRSDHVASSFVELSMLVGDGRIRI